MEKNETLLEPYNPTDPIVVIDPPGKNTYIVKTYELTNGENQINNMNQEKVDAIYAPLIKINNHVIENNNINNFTLYYTKFLPYLHLVISDEGKDIQYSDVPGLDNIITVIMTTPVNGTYKKVSIDFYITNCDFWTNTIVIDATYKSIELEKTYCKQFGSGEISTFNMLKQIATEHSLGFAATENCSSIEDTQYRQCRSKKLKDFIVDQVKHSGTSEESVFDCWVDLNGYIILVNIPWVYTTKCSANQFMIYSTPIVRSTVNDLDNDEKTVVMLQRVLSNKTYGGGENNLSIREYNSIVNTDKIQKTGALTNYWILTSPCVKNKLEYEQVQIIEESIDGKENSTNYEFENIVFLGAEMGGNLYQTKINEAYLTKIKSKQLEIELKTINLGLQRGTIVYIEIFDYNSLHKNTLINNAENADKSEAEQFDDNKIKEGLNSDTLSERLASDKTDGVINAALSGKYYIDGMKFVFNSSEGIFKHFLYVSKIGSQNNIFNQNTLVKIPNPHKDAE